MAFSTELTIAQATTTRINLRRMPAGEQQAMTARYVSATAASIRALAPYVWVFYYGNGARKPFGRGFLAAIRRKAARRKFHIAEQVVRWLDTLKSRSPEAPELIPFGESKHPGRIMRYTSKRDLIDRIRGEYQELCVHLDRIPESRAYAPGVWGDDWNVRDLTAHLAEWQRMFLGWYDSGLDGGMPAMPAQGYRWSETPALNRVIQKRFANRSLREVRADLDDGYRRIFAIAKALSQTRLLEPGQFRWTGTTSLAAYLGANSESHYRFAIKVIRRWSRGARSRPSGGVRRRPAPHRNGVA